MKPFILILSLVLCACGTLTKQQALTDAETVIAAGAVGYLAVAKRGPWRRRLTPN
jgi:hypothetical protein